MCKKIKKCGLKFTRKRFCPVGPHPQVTPSGVTVSRDFTLLVCGLNIVSNRQSLPTKRRVESHG